MKVWIGLKRGEEFVHEWTGDIASEDNLAQAVQHALSDYKARNNEPIWGLSIMVDKVPQPSDPSERTGLSPPRPVKGI